MLASSPALSPDQAVAEHEALLNGPAARPPLGVLPNFQDPPNLDALVIWTLILGLTFATIAVATRLYTKKIIIRSLQYEDYVILIAWSFLVGETICLGFAAKNRGGTHMWDVQLKIFFNLLYWVNIVAILYGFAIFFVKLSILLQYLRIFAPTRHANMFVFVGAHVCIWTNLIVYVIMIVLDIFNCTPRAKIWNPLMEGGHCLNQYANFQVTGVFNMVSDIAILILPMPSVWRLQMPLRKKVLITIIFATGVFACITAILRTYYTWKVVKSADKSNYMAPMGLWSYAELAAGMVISCLPVTPRFFQHVSHMVSSKTASLWSRKSKHSSAGQPSPILPGSADTSHRNYPSLETGKYIELQDNVTVAIDDGTQNRIQSPSAMPAHTFHSRNGGI